MTHPRVTVIKVGGSLFDWPDLPERLRELLRTLEAVDCEERFILIAGGGPAADVIRELDQIHRFGDDTAHWLAIHAMNLTALILAELLPGTVMVQSLESLSAVHSARSIAILDCRSLLEELARSGQDSLPACWEVTSDTIASWLAAQLGAHRLILVKSTALPAGTDRQGAARLGLVDPMFPVVARAQPRVEYVNLRDHAGLPELLP